MAKVQTSDVHCSSSVFLSNTFDVFATVLFSRLHTAEHTELQVGKINVEIVYLVHQTILSLNYSDSKRLH